MGDKKSIPDLIDKRLQDRLVDRGEISAAVLKQYMEQLPDLTDEAEAINLGGEAAPVADDGESA